MAIPTLAEAQAKSLAAAQAQTTPLTPEEASLKKLQDYYAQVARAETTSNPLLASKLATAQGRLDAVQRQRAAFEQVHPEYSAAAIAAEAAKAKANKTMLIGAGVLGILGVSYFAWRKFRK